VREVELDPELGGWDALLAAGQLGELIRALNSDC